MDSCCAEVFGFCFFFGGGGAPEVDTHRGREKRRGGKWSEREAERLEAGEERALCFLGGVRKGGCAQT